MNKVWITIHVTDFLFPTSPNNMSLFRVLKTPVMMPPCSINYQIRELCAERLALWLQRLAKTNHPFHVFTVNPRLDKKWAD